MLQEIEAWRCSRQIRSYGLGREDELANGTWRAGACWLRFLNVLGMALALSVVLAAGAGIASANQKYTDEDIEGLFASTCGFCHSDGGRVAGKGPQLMGTKRSDAFIIARIKNGKESRMPAFGQVLNEAEIKGIVRYIRHLKPD